MSYPDLNCEKQSDELHKEKNIVENSEPAFNYEWLDRDYIQKSIREGLEDPNIVITDFVITPATLKGDNYASVVFKCRATDQSGKEYLTIIKCLPANPMRKKFCNSGQIFRKEIDMYIEILPKFESILKEKGLTTFWPKYYYSTINGDQDTVIVEDLSPQGYIMRERRNGLNCNHLEVTLTALARFHACSVAMKFRDTGKFEKIVEKFPELIISPENDEIKWWFSVSIESASQVVRNWGGEKYMKIAEKMNDWKNTLFDELLEYYKPRRGALLNHGDCWMNNMLFKYETNEEAKTGCGKPVSIILLDFQIVKYCSPAIDLINLMVTSIDTETRKKHWRRLLKKVYLESFWNTLEILGHKDDIEKDLYTSEWLDSEMKAHQKLGFFMASVALKGILATTEEAPDIEAMNEDMPKDKDPFSNLNENELFQNRFRGLIDEFEEMGMFA